MEPPNMTEASVAQCVKERELWELLDPVKCFLKGLISNKIVPCVWVNVIWHMVCILSSVTSVGVKVGWELLVLVNPPMYILRAHVWSVLEKDTNNAIHNL
jgi:hypothetical protein